MTARHPLVQEAIIEAADRIEFASSFGELWLELGLGAALRERFDPAMVEALGDDRDIQIPDWKPSPRGIDMVVRHRLDGDFRFTFELKIDDVHHTLWDIYKMLSALRLPQNDPVEAAFIVVAASQSRWAGGHLAPRT